MVFAVLAAMAQLERDLISERVQLDMRAARVAGKHIGTLTFYVMEQRSESLPPLVKERNLGLRNQSGLQRPLRRKARQLRHVSAFPRPAALRAELLVLPPQERNGLMKSRLRQLLRSPLRPTAVHPVESAALVPCGFYFFAAAKTLFWPGATLEVGGRSRPTLQRYCILARCIPSCRISCRSCRRFYEGANEQSSNPQKREPSSLSPCILARSFEAFDFANLQSLKW